MKTMEASFKQNAFEQLMKFTSLLEQHIASTDHHFSQLMQAPQEQSTPVGKPSADRGSDEASSQVSGVREGSAPPPSDLNSILKTFRVDVTRFDNNNLED